MSISRIINKTPLANERSNIYETTINDELIKTILQSRFIGEGVYCLEQFSVDDYTEQYLSTPSYDKYGNSITKDWHFDDCIVYELILEKPHFLPLDTKQYINLFKVISEMEYPVLTQMLLVKRVDNWRDLAITKYEHFLNGMDEVADIKLIRNVQSKVINVLNKVANYNVQRNPIQEIEDKICQHNYRFECRFILFEDENREKFEENVQKELKKLSFFNELALKRVKNKKYLLNCIKNRSFQPEINQLLSEKEIISLVCENEVQQSYVSPVTTKKKGVVQKLEESQLLQRAIQILPFKESQQREVDQTLPKRINNAFKRVGITEKDFKVVETHVGSSLLKVTMLVPPNLVFTQVKKKLEDIQAALGNTGVSIEIGSQPDTINVYMPVEERDIVYLRNVLESENFQAFCKSTPLPFIIGESVDGGFLFGCLTKLRQVLIAGTNGSGKSNFATLLLLTLLICVPSDELDMYLIDPKRVEFSLFEGFPQVKKIETDMKKSTILLDQLVLEMEKRFELMSKIGVKDIVTFNNKSNEKMTYIVCAVDEFADLMMVNANVEDFIVRIAQKGRAAGVHLILLTQRPSVDVVTGLIKANMPARFSFKVASGVDSKTILDTVGAEKLLGLGDAYARIEGNTRELERFQAPVLTLNKVEEESIYDNLKKLFADLPTSDSELEDVIIEEPIEKLKRIIVNTGELRLSELQSLMKIKMNTVSDLMKQLVSEGFLSKEGKGYSITASQDEFDKWKEVNE